MDDALLFARASPGSSIPARIAMMAITTSSSISVKAWRRLEGVLGRLGAGSIVCLL
jgi:hypothetical protein